MDWTLQIVEAALFTAGCIVIHAFRGRPERLTEGLAFVSIFLLILVLVGGAARIAPAIADDETRTYVATAQ